MKSVNKKAGIYIHFPFCKVKCGYCDFYSITNKEHQIDDYFKYLHREIDLFSEKFNSRYLFDTLFIGGGTPSLSSAQNIEELLKKLDEKFNLNNLKEFTMEANPGEAPKELLADLNSIGVNRISFGFQSLNPEILSFLDRIHSPQDCLDAFDNARKAGFENINIDMIFNIPNQHIKTLKENLKTIISLSPNHISNYSLTVEPGTPLYEWVNSGKVIMPDEDTDIKMFQEATKLLEDNGYQQYEVSNFAKNGMRCLHNLHYWNLDPYLAFGPSAHGYDGNNRWWNYKSLNKYTKALSKNKMPTQDIEILTKKDKFNEIILNGLRTSSGINLEELLNIKNDISIRKNIEEKTNKWPSLTLSQNYLKLESNDFMLLDEITADLFI